MSLRKFPFFFFGSGSVGDVDTAVESLLLGSDGGLAFDDDALDVEDSCCLRILKVI
jgi:hypothetical protein